MPQIADVAILIKAALESTIYLAPDELGLSYDEIVEVTTRLGFRLGEINDAMKLLNSPRGTSVDRWGPTYDTVSKWPHFFVEEDPPLINFKALDFFVQQLQESARDLGARQARIDTDVTIQRGARSGFGEHELRVARRILILSERVAEKDSVLTFPNGSLPHTLPSQQAKMF
jgi:hypothetical protein